MKYTVFVPELHIAEYCVEAKDPREAVNIIATQYWIEPVDLQYECVLPGATCEVCEEQGNDVVNVEWPED